MNDEIVDFGKKPPDTVDDEIVTFGPVKKQPPTDWKAVKEFKYTPGWSLSPQVTKIAEDKVKATMALSSLTGADPEMVQFGVEAIGEELYGEKVDAPGIFQRIVNSWDSFRISRDKNKIGSRMALGIDTPEDAKALAEINESLPAPEETLKTIPNAILNFIYQTYTGGKIILGEPIGIKVERPRDNVQRNVLQTLASSITFHGGPLEYPVDITEQCLGASYLAQIESGVDPTIARFSSAGISAVNIAMNMIPMARAMGAGQKVVVGGLLKGSGVVLKELGIQAAFGYGQAAVDTLLPEVAKVLSEAVTKNECTFKDAKQILVELGIEGTFNTLPDLVTAAVGMGSAVMKVKRGGALDLALAEQIRKAEVEVAKPKTIGETPAEKPYVPAAPGEQNIGKIMALTDADAAKLDASVKSTESSADYINATDLPAKQVAKMAVDDYKAQLEARSLTKQYIKKISDIDTSELRPEFAAPIEEMKSVFTKENFSESTLARLNYMRGQIADNPEMDVSPDVLYKLGEMNKTPLKNLSVDDLKLLSDMAVYYKTLQIKSNKVLFEGRLEEKGKVLQAIGAELKEPKEIAGTIKAVAGAKEHIQDAYQKAAEFIGKRSERVGLVMDKVSPTLKKAAFDPVFEGYKTKLTDKAAFDLDFKQRMEPVVEAVGDFTKWANAGETIKLNNAQSIEATRAFRISLYLHSQNEQNVAHILDGGIGMKFAGGALRNKVFKVTPEALNEIVTSVQANPQEMQVVRAVQDMVGQLGTRQAEVYLRENNIPLKLVDNYWHIETMAVGRGSTAEQEAISTQAKKTFYGIGQSKGHLISRTDSTIPIYVNPFWYDLAVARDHGISYIDLEAPLRNAGRLLGDLDLKNGLRDSTGSNTTHNIIVKAMKDVAGQSDTQIDFETTMTRVRNNMATAYMAFPNLFVPLKQPGAFMRYGAYIKPKYLLEGMYESIMHPKDLEATMTENSGLYATRTAHGRSREVSDILQRAVTGTELGGKQGFVQKLMSPIGWADTRGSVRPGMYGAVLQAIDELGANAPSADLIRMTGIDPAKVAGMTPDEKITVAYKFAEAVTEATQTSGNPLLQSDIQRGKPIEQMYTLFMSENFTAMNLRRQAFFEARSQNTPHAWAKFSKVALITLIAEPLYELGVNRLRKETYGQKQQPIEKEVAAQFVNYLFQGVPIVNQVEQQIVNKVVMGWQAQGNAMTPIDNLANAVTTVINLSLDDKSYRTKKGAIALAKAVNEATGLITGLPLSPTWRLIEGGANLYKKLEPE
jgi:hypothetical protein